MLFQVFRPVAVGFVPGETVLACDDCEGEIEVGGYIADPLLAQVLVLLILEAGGEGFERVEEKHDADGMVEVRGQRFAEVFGEVVGELVADFLGGAGAKFEGELSPGGVGKESAPGACASIARGWAGSTI